MQVDAVTITQVYKNRWHVELFFIDAIIKFEPLQQLPAAPILSNRAK